MSRYLLDVAPGDTSVVHLSQSGAPEGVRGDAFNPYPLAGILEYFVSREAG